MASIKNEFLKKLKKGGVTSITTETLQKYMEDDGFNPLIASLVVSRSSRDEAQKVMDQSPDFKTKLLEYFTETSGWYIDEKNYNGHMCHFTKFTVIETLKTYHRDEEFLRSRPDAPKKLLRSFFCKRRTTVRYNDNNERIQRDEWVERDNYKISKRYQEVIEILMNCYLLVMKLYIPEISDVILEDIVLEYRIVKKIQTWLQLGYPKIKSANTQ